MADGIWRPRADFDRLFRGDRFRFEFGIRPAEGEWFRCVGTDGPELQERRKLLAEQPNRHAPWSTEADPVIREVLELFPGSEVPQWTGEGRSLAIQLAGCWEPDFVLLSRDGGTGYRMAGGCVCDPSWWSPAEKLGLPLRNIHDPVPTLNESLAARIDTFLDRLPPGETYSRENWGLAAVPDRNLHPELHRPRLVPGTPLRTSWLRVEYQAFRALPRTRGILFGIWLEVYSMEQVISVPGAAAGFRRMLSTMPAGIAHYKGLDGVLEEWVRQL